MRHPKPISKDGRLFWYTAVRFGGAELGEEFGGSTVPGMTAMVTPLAQTRGTARGVSAWVGTNTGSHLGGRYTCTYMELYEYGMYF